MESEASSRSVWLLPVLVALAVGMVLFAVDQLRDDTPEPAPEPTPEASGSAACASCHDAVHAAWSTSTHALAERPLRPSDPLTEGTLVLEGPDGEAPYAPVRAIGVDPLVQYLVPLDDGRLQATQRAWDPAAEEWFDVFGDGREPGEWGHWTGGAMTWNSQCAACHDTEVDKGYDEATGTYDTTFAELGVGCAACHGEVDAHLLGGAPPSVPGERMADVCASCHARRAELTGAFAPGERFEDHFAPTFADRSDTYWPDGQVRDEDFEYSAFRTSRMHAAGIGCVDCHDPHSGSVRAEGDALCLSCHQALPGFEPHDPHPAEAAPGCVGCHMPITTYMQRDPRHDHGFRVPDPVLTARHGIPSACGRCHPDTPTAELVATVGDWYPELGGPRRHRADVLARGKAGEASAEELSALLSDPGVPGSFRASAAAMLGGYLADDPEQVAPALVDALDDPDPWVRFAAVGAVAPAAVLPEVQVPVRTALSDEVRAVRVEAARALRPTLAPTAPEVADYARYLSHNADQPTALLERASWALQRGQVRDALSDLQRAVELDPGSAPLYDTLGLAWARAGDAARAAAALERAVALAPDDPELWYRLALARGSSDPEGTEAALLEALERDPDHVASLYNLGVVLGGRQAWSEAVATLERAVELAPDQVDVRYALASTLYRAGRPVEATVEARRVLAQAPGHPSATALLDAVEQTP